MKLKDYIIIGLVVGLGILFFMFRAQGKKYDDLLVGKDKEEQKIIRKERDRANRLLDSTVNSYSEKILELENKKNEIKYITYEKYTYSDRTLDSAIIILSDSKY